MQLKIVGYYKIQLKWHWLYTIIKLPYFYIFGIVFYFLIIIYEYYDYKFNLK